MKRIVLLLLAIIFLSWPFSVQALSQIMPDYPDTSRNQNEQYYSVIFDEEQEADVVAKLTFLNQTSQESKNLVLEIPGQNIRFISLIQQKFVIDDVCILYDTSPEPLKVPQSQRPCLKTESQQTGESSFVLLERDKTKDKRTVSGLQIDLPLKEPIASGDSGTIILSYKATGFVTPRWNGFEYNFQTIKSDYDINKVRVAIDVTGDLYIKTTAQSQTNYQFNLPSATSSLSAESFTKSTGLESIARDLPQATGVVKETSSLDPGENFQVEGFYYALRFWGELPTMIGVGITFLIIFGVLIYIIKKEKSRAR